MRFATVFPLLAVLLPPAAAQNAGQNSSPLAAQVAAAAATVRGTLSLYAKNLDTGRDFGISENTKVRTASTIKLPVLVALYAEIAAGRARWDETLELRAEDKVSGSGVVRELSPGLRLPLRDLANLMIVVSDNTATNLILDRITAQRVNEVMDSYGLAATRSMRKVLGDGKDLKPVASGHSKAGLLEENRRFGLGSSTPREMVALLEKLARGEVVNAAASREIIETMKRQQYKDGIGRRVAGMSVASKSGSLDRLRSDAGLVWSPGGLIALAITIDDLEKVDYSDDNAGSSLIADLAKLLVAGLAR